jgi:RNA-binding protein
MSNTSRHAAGDAQPAPVAPTLTASQRKHLRGLAHELSPIVLVGQGGLTGAVFAAVDAALATHELIKVRLRQPGDKKAMASDLAAQTSAALCGLVGHMVILYRPDPEQPRLRLPRR